MIEKKLELEEALVIIKENLEKLNNGMLLSLPIKH